MPEEKDAVREAFVAWWNDDSQNHSLWEAWRRGAEFAKSSQPERKGTMAEKLWRDRVHDDAEAVAKEWWDALDKDREIDWGDIADLVHDIARTIPIT